MIPAGITASLSLWSASVMAARPVRQASPILKAALVDVGTVLVSDIDAALAGAVGSLDDDDPAGYAGDLVTALTDLATATYDQATLADMRGTVGRALFNLGAIAGRSIGTSSALPTPGGVILGAVPPGAGPGVPLLTGAIGEMAIGIGAIGVIG